MCKISINTLDCIPYTQSSLEKEKKTQATTLLRENYLLWPWIRFILWNSGNQTWSFVMNWNFSSSGGLESATGQRKKKLRQNCNLFAELKKKMRQNLKNMWFCEFVMVVMTFPESLTLKVMKPCLELFSKLSLLFCTWLSVGYWQKL